LIFGAGNINNPYSPGEFPKESTVSPGVSVLADGDQIVWLGGGERQLVTLDDNDNRNTQFDEASTSQKLVNDMTFAGQSYTAGEDLTPSYVIQFQGSDGNTYEMVSSVFETNDENNQNSEVDAIIWMGNIPPENTTLTVLSQTNPLRVTAPEYATFATCFCSGTLIENDRGKIPVEHIRTGDRVLTQNGEFEEVLLITNRKIKAQELENNYNLRPVVISAGSLGPGIPSRSLRVSKQHRICASSPISGRMFGEDKVLVAAIHLTNLPGIYIDEEMSEVCYFHIILENHSIMFAEGAPAESLYLGENALATLSHEALEELKTIFPDLLDRSHRPTSKYPIPKGKLQKQLVYRHEKNSMPFVDALSSF